MGNRLIPTKTTAKFLLSQITWGTSWEAGFLDLVPMTELPATDPAPPSRKQRFAAATQGPQRYLRRQHQTVKADHNQPLVSMAMVAIGSAALAVAALGWIDSRTPERPPVLVAAAPVPTATPVPTPSPTPTSTPVPEATNLVHVSGRVAQPGVVEVSIYSRAIDAIELAGGTLHNADLDRINLAAPTFDGERIHVPTIGDDEPEVVESERPEIPVPQPTPTFVPLLPEEIAALELPDPATS